MLECAINAIVILNPYNNLITITVLSAVLTAGADIRHIWWYQLVIRLQYLSNLHAIRSIHN